MGRSLLLAQAVTASRSGSGRTRTTYVYRSSVGDDPVDDASDGPPGDARQLAHGGPRAVGDEPRHLIAKGPRVARSLARPWHERDRRPMLGTAHPRRTLNRPRGHNAVSRDRGSATCVVPLPGHCRAHASHRVRSDADGPCGGARGRRRPPRHPRRPISTCSITTPWSTAMTFRASAMARLRATPFSFTSSPVR